jgi:hypothetical protein
MRRTILLVVVAMLAASCGSAAERLTERAVERAIESESGGEARVDLSEDDGEVSLEFETDDGTGSIVIGGGELPEGLPVPVPDGGEVVSTFTAEGADGTTYTVTVLYEGDRVEELSAFYESWMRGEADDVQKTTTSGDFVSTTLFSDALAAYLSISLSEGDTTVLINSGG